MEIQQVVSGIYIDAGALVAALGAIYHPAGARAFEGLPLLLHVQIPLKTRDEFGFITKEESRGLNKWIRPAEGFLERNGGKKVGVVTSSGVHHLYSYLPEDERLVAKVKGAVGGFAEYQVTVEILQDRAAMFYRTTFAILPNFCRQKESLEARVKALGEKGEDLKVPRMVEHEVVFAGEKERAAFVEWAIKGGFVMGGMYAAGAEGLKMNRSLGVRVRRAEVPNMNLSLGTLHQVIAAAAIWDGVYLGNNCVA